MAEAEVTPRPEWNADGSCDHDRPYVWERTDLYLIPQERGLLRVLRADIRHGRYADDLTPELEGEAADAERGL